MVLTLVRASLFGSQDCKFDSPFFPSPFSYRLVLRMRCALHLRPAQGTLFLYHMSDLTSSFTNSRFTIV